MQAISDNLARVRDNVANAALRAGREPSEITLVGVSKYVSAAASAQLVNAGCRDLGESRPQQLWVKAVSPELESLNVRWHVIGHLQRNKVARTVPLATLIHSVDSPRLLAAIDHTANEGATSEPGKRQAVLLEVNTSGEAEKLGFTADSLREFLPTIGEYPSVEIQGLMTMAARDGSLSTAGANFAALRDLRDELAPLSPEGTQLAQLSMGMSADYEIAIAEGATFVRVGSALWQGVE